VRVTACSHSKIESGLPCQRPPDFHDDGTNIPYDNVGISFEANQVINRAAVQHAGNQTPQIAEDLASQATYFIQTTAISRTR
jgi:hypothetical protein